MTWAGGVAWIVVLMQAAFGALELLAPRVVLDRVFPGYYDTRGNPVWDDAAVIARNMGLYNWFLAAGLALALTGMLGGGAAAFFLACVCLAGVFGIFSVGPSAAFFGQFGVALVALLMRCV